MTLTHIYQEDNLKKRVMRFGAESLTDRELFYLLIGEFLPAKKSQKLTVDYFEEFGNLKQLQYFTSKTLQNFLQDKQASIFLEIICEFAQRYKKRGHLNLGQICSSKKVGEYMIDYLGDYKQENLVLILLDTKNYILAIKTLFVGTLNSSLVHPREIFNMAVRYSAARFMVVHNHPSGIVTPSENDIVMTNRLKKCGELLGIELLDHLIVGDTSYCSMREEEIL